MGSFKQSLNKNYHTFSTTFVYNKGDRYLYKFVSPLYIFQLSYLTSHLRLNNSDN